MTFEELSPIRYATCVSSGEYPKSINIGTNTGAMIAHFAEALPMIKFKKDEIDTRVKHIFLTDEGKKLFDEIFSIQKKRIYKAFLGSDSNEVISFDKVLRKIINEKF